MPLTLEFARGRGRFGRLVSIAIRCVASVSIASLATPLYAQSVATPYTTGYRYDKSHRLVGVLKPDPDGTGSIKYAATRYTYDARGVLVRVEVGELASWQSENENSLPANWATPTPFTVFQQTDYTYDTYGRKVSEQLSSGGTAYALKQFSYDGNGRLECTAVRMNTAAFATDLPNVGACALGAAGSAGPDRITRMTYDTSDRPLTELRAYGTSIQQTYATYTYSGAHLASLTDANINRETFDVDGLGRPLSLHFPSPTTHGQTSTTDFEQYGYDANGDRINRTSLRKRDTRIINYQYDHLNRLVYKDIPSSATSDVYYQYDLRGLQTAATFGVSSATCNSTTPGICTSYDGFGRVTSSTNSADGVVRTLLYQYDGDGDRVKITHPDGAAFTYGYDGLDRAQYLCESTAQSTAPCIATNSPIVSMTYDSHGRRWTMSRVGSTTTTSTYGYDPVSRLQSLALDLDGAATTSDGTFGFTYSPASQVLTRSINKGIYAYTNGPSSQTLYAPNGLNQYGTIFGTSTVTPTYDGNANMTFDGNFTYGYDVENRLVSATKAATIINVGYDPNGRLLTIDSGLAATSTHFLYDGDNLVAEYDSNNVVKHRYVHGPGADEPVVWYQGATVSAAARYFTIANHQGSIVAVNGATTQINTYDVYGVPATSNTGRFQYTGQIWLPQIGLYYYKARIYNPALGRFMQTDPVGYKDDVDLYSYVGNDPANRSDPTGLRGETNAPPENATDASDDEFKNCICGAVYVNSDMQPDTNGNGQKNGNSDSANSDTLTPAPATAMEASGKRGNQGKGERGQTGKSPRKRVRPSRDQPGRFEERDNQTGKWKPLPPNYVPPPKRESTEPFAPSPPGLTPGEKVGAGLGVLGVAGGILCVLAEPCGATVAAAAAAIGGVGLVTATP